MDVYNLSKYFLLCFYLQQVAILRIIPRIFSLLLADSNPVVQQMSLENFAQFAEETAHETIVPESLQQDEQIQTRVVSYLSLVGVLSVNILLLAI